MRKLIFSLTVSALIGLSLTACSSNTEKPDLGFSVVKEEKTNDTKRLVSVELDHRLNEKELASIASYLKSLDSNYGKIFVVFRIKNEDRQAYWADATFSKDSIEPEVKIFGSTIEEEATLQKEVNTYTIPSGSELIGKWINRSSYDSVIVFYRKDGKVFSDEIFASGINNKQYKEKNNSTGKYFQAGDSVDGYQIDQAGNLNILNTEENRVFLKLKKI
jgi:hypothetical protein